MYIKQCPICCSLQQIMDCSKLFSSTLYVATCSFHFCSICKLKMHVTSKLAMINNDQLIELTESFLLVLIFAFSLQFLREVLSVLNCYLRCNTIDSG